MAKKQNIEIANQQVMNLDRLVPAPWNYKLEEPEKLSKFIESVRRNQFIYPLVIAQRAEEPDNEAYEVLDGNHRLEALRKYSTLKEVPCVVFGRLTMNERKRLGVELNEWSFAKEPYRFAELFNDFSVDFSIDDLAATMPFESSDIVGFIEMISGDSGGFENGISGSLDMGDDTELPSQSAGDKVPSVTLIFATHSDYNDFIQLTGNKDRKITWNDLKSVMFQDDSDDLGSDDIAPEDAPF